MMDAYFWQVPALLAAGCLAGFLNVLAGGGSLLTLPLLIFMGLPAATANGTNRIAIFCQNIFAITGFRKKGVFPLRLALLCAPPALLGSWLGANLAIAVDEETFRRLLALAMLGVLLFISLDPAKKLRQQPAHMAPLRVAVLLVSFFAVGIYGGFVQAGVGFLIITALLIHGLDLVTINAVKVLVIFAFTIVALAVFIRHGQIDYGLGLSLAAGNSLGGWIGTHVAVSRGHDWIKRFVSLTVLIFAIKLLFF